jgi:hypothetical protein
MCARYVIAIASETDDDSFVTATLSRTGNDPLGGNVDCATASQGMASMAFVECTKLVHKRSQNGCASSAQPAIQLVCNSDRYRFVTVAFWCTGSNSLSGNVNCAAASRVIACPVFAECAKFVHDRSQNGCAPGAQAVIRLVRKPDRYRLMTAGVSRTDLRPHCGDHADAVAVPEVDRTCASCALKMRTQNRMGLLPKLRLGETHVPLVVFIGRKENTSGCGRFWVCTPLVVAINDAGK